MSACVGLESHSSSLAGVSVYPNPNSGVFTVEMNGNLNASLEISDLTGRIVFKGSCSEGKTNVNINDLANGIYYVKVQSAGQFEVFKVVKQ